MTSKLITNSALTSAALIAFLGIVARRAGFPWISDALAFFKLPGVEINWNGIWLMILIISVVFLIAVNLSAARKWNNARVERNTRHWNMNLCDALNYLAYLSVFGAAWPDQNKIQVAAGAVYEAAHKGTIEISGQRRGSLLLTKISENWFSGGTILELKHCTRDGEKNVFLLDSDKTTVIYSSLTVDRVQIERVWARAPARSW
jgi:hypothetical protein